MLCKWLRSRVSMEDRGYRRKMWRTTEAERTTGRRTEISYTNYKVDTGWVSGSHGNQPHL